MKIAKARKHKDGSYLLGISGHTFTEAEAASIGAKLDENGLLVLEYPSKAVVGTQVTNAAYEAMILREAKTLIQSVTARDEGTKLDAEDTDL